MFEFMQKKKPEDKGASKTPTPPLVNKPTITNVVPNIVITAGAVAKTDYALFFEKLIEDSNLPGPDYFEFYLALRKKDGALISEDQKYKDIMDILSSMVKPTVIVSSGRKYIELCNSKGLEFEETYKKDTLSSVDQKRSRAKVLQKEIEEMEKSIKQKEETINTLLTEAANNEQTLAIEKHAFTTALKNKVDMIENHLTNIQKFI